MNCTICQQPVILRPSAAERAAKCGGSPADYVKLFPRHAECELRERNRPVPRKPISELPVIFQNLELHSLRVSVAKRLYGVDSGSKEAADYVNNLNEAALLELL